MTVVLKTLGPKAVPLQGTLGMSLIRQGPDWHLGTLGLTKTLVQPPRAVSSSPKQEQQGRGDQDSPDEGATKTSTFLSDLHQAIEPAVRDKDSR